jgi:hypothetical protein
MDQFDYEWDRVDRTIDRLAHRASGGVKEGREGLMINRLSPT